MADYRVTCVTKNANAHESITHLGGPNWRDTKENIILYINNKTHTFYTLVNNQRAEVGVVQGGPNKSPYLRTHADGYYNDNLLALPSCG